MIVTVICGVILVVAIVIDALSDPETARRRRLRRNRADLRRALRRSS